MEPMHLGSPTHTNYLGTPGQLGSPGGGGGPTGGYLPGYLMGDHQMSPLQASPLPSRQQQLHSPSKLNRSMSNMSSTGTGATPSTPLPFARTGPSLLKENLNSSNNRLHSRTDKPGGPPTTGLLSGITPNSTFNSPMNRFDTTNGFDGTPSKTQEVYQGEENSDPLSVWVTVFGFPPAAASYVISQLSTSGTILQHVLPPNANWMHLRFQTRLQARRALSKTGTILGGTIMIGVTGCTDDTVLDQANTSMSVLDTSMVGSGVANLSSAFGTPRTIRPLAQAYKDAQTENKVVPCTNTPNKSSGIVSKAMGYMFGW